MVTIGGASGAGPSRASLNFRGPETRPSAGGAGTRPTTQPASVRGVLVVMVLHLCKKSIFFDVKIKVGLYLAALFLVSLLADFSSFPKTYFSRSDNVFNRYFVKIGWFWTLILTVPFVLMTSYTTCCGKRDRVVKGHFTRLAIATCFWYIWTGFFNYVENSYGKCIPKNYPSKQTCLEKGHFWNGFDLSGHCFILIYSSLILIEEARAILGWEGIRDFIRDEDYARSINDKTIRTNPLRYLESRELSVLRTSYDKFTPYVRGIFIAMTVLQLLWDVMLLCTLMYYHIMVEKFVSGVIAILTWYVTYHAWYKLPKYFPNLPGEGVFKYNKDKSPISVPLSSKKRASLVNNGKHFMGMPIHGFKSQESSVPVVEDQD